jgi:hypothetical protein
MKKGFKKQKAPVEDSDESDEDVQEDSSDDEVMRDDFDGEEDER